MEALAFGDIELNYEMSEEAFAFSVNRKNETLSKSIVDFKNHLYYWIGRYHRLNEDFVESMLDEFDIYQARVIFETTRRESSKIFLRLKWAGSAGFHEE